MPALPLPPPIRAPRRRSTGFALLLGALGLLAVTPIAFAHPRPTTPDHARLVRLEVVDRDSGAALPQYPYRRERWVAGEDGQPYILRLSNLTGALVLVVLSVDGINVVTGETADPSQSGYVLAPYATAEIDGWRKSMHEVAAFRFSAAEGSYAARTGRPSDLGVIGAAVFREAATLAEHSAAPRAQAAEAMAGADAARAASPTSPLGTAHGERRWSPSARTHFVRARAAPDEVVALRYERRDALLARGVIRVERQPWWAREPRAFPGGFVPDP